MIFELLCMTGEMAGRRHRIERTVTIGSAPDNDIVLDSATVSRRHAKIDVDEAGDWRVTDLGSSNGTRLDGDPVREPEVLGDLHVITFAEKHDFILRAIDRGESS